MMSFTVPFSAAYTAENALGRPDTTEQKMMSDMPLPMPRLVMSSPIHINSAEPAVKVVTIRMTRCGAEVGHQVEVGLTAGEPTATVVEEEDEAGRLEDRDADRDVAGPLRDLLLADRALLLPFLQLRDHHGQDLHDDRAGDVRHDPEREEAEAA